MQNARRLIIDGRLCWATDVGCQDFERAAWNRCIVDGKLFVEWWEAMEQALSHTPTAAPLPAVVRIGNIPEHRPTQAGGFAVPVEAEENETK